MGGMKIGRTWKVNTLKAMGRDLLDLQWLGRGLHNMQGEPVWTSSPCSPKKSCSKWSGTILTTLFVFIIFYNTPIREICLHLKQILLSEKTHTHNTLFLWAVKVDWGISSSYNGSNTVYTSQIGWSIFAQFKWNDFFSNEVSRRSL